MSEGPPGPVFDEEDSLTPTTPRRVPILPLVGRSGELRAIREALDRTARGEGGALLVAGRAGTGKTRLAAAAEGEASRRGFVCSAGRSYPAESRVPYALFCDLLDPLVRDASPEGLLTVTRGAPEFQLVCPSLATLHPEGSPALREGIPDLRNRLLWNFPRFLNRLRADRPLLLVLDDLQWADPSSLVLFHFLGRQASTGSLLLLATFTLDGREVPERLREIVHSLTSDAGASLLDLSPLDESSVMEGVSHAFEVDPSVVRGFAGNLHHWTGGNPLFVQATLDSLVEAGRLHQVSGRWVGWNLEDVAPPSSVRDLVLERLDRLDPAARTVAELAAVAGTRVRFSLLERVSRLPEGELFGALRQLRDLQILEERAEGEEVVLTYVHPLVREILYREMGPARTRLVHAELAEALEALHGPGALRHAGELAVHFSRAGPGVLAAKGVAYLAAAGRLALGKHANREAVGYLEEARSRLASLEEDLPPAEAFRLLTDLAGARLRVGEYGEARTLLEEARELARDPESEARVERRLGLCAFWEGRIPEALDHVAVGLEAARAAGDPSLEARLHLAAAFCHQEVGRPEEARMAAGEALRLGEEHDIPQARAAAHRSLLLLHTWMGPPDKAREHGEKAVALAGELDDPSGRFSAHWAMAVLGGLTGDAGMVRRHLDEAWKLARAVDSPLLRLRVAEVEIEVCQNLGEWEQGMDMAEEALRMARELNQQVSLTRLLVWSGLLHLSRGEVRVAREQLDEAWELAGLEDPTPATTHGAILAHLGRASLHLAEGNHSEAIRVGEAGLELVDRTGYRAWAVHRLLPIVAEASLHVRDLERAVRTSERLRQESESFDHRLAGIWADAVDALVEWLKGADIRLATERMMDTADALESLDMVPDAARLRRQIAGRLADLGERDAAVRELRRVHDTLAALGAGPELDKARGQFREVGARPPSRSAAPGTGGLTDREEEIARLVGERKSNKAIARALGISPRTVGTHLSNVYKKLEVSSRAELGDRVKEGLLD